jgi:hypothetical protein
MERSTGTPDQPRGLFVTGRGLVLPAVIWALYFTLVYAAQGAGCAAAVQAPGPEGFGPLRAILLALTLAATGAIAATGFGSWRTLGRVRPVAPRDPAFERATFLAQGALLSAGLFLIATLWVGLPILVFDPCRGHTLW